MADVFAETFRAMIDHWMETGLEPYANMMAIIALATHATYLMLRRDR